MARLSAADVEFLNLQQTVLCIDCELISYNNTDQCLSCGSRALLSLSRVLGGSLRPQETARLVTGNELPHALAQILNTSFKMEPHLIPESPVAARPVLNAVVQQACALTGAEGSALATYHEGGIICTARFGHTAPPLGTTLYIGGSLSGRALREGRAMHCERADQHPHVDQIARRNLGVQSIVVAPLIHLENSLGILEVLSSQPSAFDDRDVATVQLLAGMAVLAMMRQSIAAPVTAEPLPA